MADITVKMDLIGIKIITREFSQSLFTNLYLEFRNPVGQKLLDSDENSDDSGVFEVAKCGLNN